jgi:hypothetical protein
MADIKDNEKKAEVRKRIAHQVNVVLDKWAKLVDKTPFCDLYTLPHSTEFIADWIIAAFYKTANNDTENKRDVIESLVENLTGDKK